MDQNDTVEHFIMLVLSNFVSKQLSCSLSFVDDIIVEYMVAILEDFGNDCTEVESSFDIKDFVEMMTAYIPGFDQIDSAIVTEWIFSVATKIQSGKWLEESIAMQKEEKKKKIDKNNNVTCSNHQCSPSVVSSCNTKSSDHLYSSCVISPSCNATSGDHWYSLPTVSSSVLFPTNNATENILFPTGDTNQSVLFPPISNSQGMMFSQEETIESVISDDNEQDDTKNDDREHNVPDLMSVDVSNCKHIKRHINTAEDTMGIHLNSEHFPSLNYNPSYNNLNSAHVSECGDDLESTKMRYSEKVDYLSEMFPDIPQAQLKRCLSRAKSNVEKAVATILHSRNDGSKKVNSKKEQEEAAATNSTEDIAKTEKEIAKLMEMFPRLSECRIRDRYCVVGNNSERAMRVILSEEESRANGYRGKNLQVHKTSFKKMGLSEQDENKLKQDTISKYSYVVDDHEKEHHPIILVKKDSTNKVGSLSTEDKSVNVNSTVNNCDACIGSKVEAKQSNNPKLNRKHRYR